MPDDHFSYGGQAVIEGVMIRGRRGYATALRLADGNIEVARHAWEPLSRRHRLLSLPIIRGTPALIDSLTVGYRSLIASADVAARGEGIKPPSAFHYGLSIATALAITIGGFVLLPSAVMEGLSWNPLLLNFAEGAVRFCFFILFIFGISLMPDMRRVFQYHGAEHKVINSFEETGRYGEDEVQPYGTVHRRCGTSFIFMVLFIGILIHAVVGWPTWYWRLLSRLLLLPLVVGVSYELIKLSSAHKKSRLLGLLVAPGVWLQGITTREPSPDQIEVAVRSLDAARELDEASATA